MQIAIAVILAAAVAVAARRARVLNTSGAWAAWIVGALVFACGGWRYAAVLFSFFIPAAALSRVGRARKRAIVTAGKEGPRDAGQVLANGGIAALCALLAFLVPPAALLAAFAGAFAAAAADTFGTEIGTLARRAPRSILTLRPLATGLSGGVTLPGTLAEAAGACLVAGVAWAAGVTAWWPIAAGGMAGALADSLLGAALQERRYCPACNAECEMDPHACGTPTRYARGLPWMNNDTVNALATAVGAGVGAALSFAAG